MMFTPKTGSVDIRMGSNAQCIAHAIDVKIPRASQFNLIFIIKAEDKGNIFAIMLQILFL